MGDKKKPASNVEWKKWGDLDPLWAVAAWRNKRKGGEDPWNDREFYQLGESDWADFSVHWERYGINRTSVLEIGCGAGRITLQLAKYFLRVHALDVSEGMLAYAREHVKAENVDFHLSDGVEIPLPGNAVTAVFSSHVFQHFDSTDIATEYFREIYRVLQHGGSLMIHLPIYAWPYGTGIAIPLLYRIRKTADDIWARINRSLIAKFKLRPTMRMTSFPVDYLYESLAETGFVDVEISIFLTKINAGLHPFVFARK